MLNQPNLKDYIAYLELQAHYTRMYKDLKEQYKSCQCFDCKIQVMTFGLELVALNAFIEEMEAEIAPEVGTILNKMEIAFKVNESGNTELTN